MSTFLHLNLVLVDDQRKTTSINVILKLRALIHYDGIARLNGLDQKNRRFVR
jgi:hypothetical protein